MKMSKIILSITACWSLFSVGLNAQHQENTIPHNILEEFKQGVLTADEAYIHMKEFYQNGLIHKCSTPLHIFEYKHQDEISSALIRSNKKVRNKASSGTYTSDSGKFKLSYETTGADSVPATDANTNGIPDYVEWAAESADESYDYLVETLGYTDPIPNGSTYDISFEEIVYYGYTETIDGSGPGTRIVIENDFVGFPSNDDPDGNQRGALRVTVAHEFKHAIQFAQNDFNGEADRWGEMDATLAEEVVYDQVNDYYNYLGSSSDIFGSPESGLFRDIGCPVTNKKTQAYGCYEDITWALYFHEKIGTSFWPGAWSRIENSVTDLPLLDAVDQELTSRGLDYTESLLELYAWHFVAGAYRNENFGFDESMFYPTPNVQSNITEVNDQYSETLTLGRFAAYMANVVPPSNQTGDVSVLMETDSVGLSMAVVALFDNGTVELEFAENEYWTTFPPVTVVVNEGWKWNEIERLGVVVFNERQNGIGKFRVKISDTVSTTIPIDNTKPTKTELKQNYPNPFNPSTTIPISISEFQRVKVDIYDITGRLVQSVFDGNLSNGNYALPINLERFASGVYLYRLKTNDKVQIKRMTLVK